MHKLFKFIPAEFPELEDDSYEFIANPNLHIQVSEADGKCIVQKLENWDTDEAAIRTLYSCNYLSSAMMFIIKLEE